MAPLLRLLAALTLLSLPAFAAEADHPPVLFREPLSPRNASYRIEVSLDADAHELRGTETIRWRNLTGVPATELAFHLYMNGFANDATLFMKESGGGHRGFRFDEQNLGYVVVSSLAFVEGGREIPLKQGFPGPDRTVMRAALPAPVPPGGEIEVRASFEVKLPKVFARTGWAGRFHMAGQWFPKLGVWEGAKGWNCHSFHYASEFFSDFGVYDVAIDVPDDYVVGATGVVWAERPGKPGRKIVLCHAEDVHDFAWTASPLFVERLETWRGVTLRVLMQPENTSSVRRYFDAARRALEFLDRSVGAYPYSVLTIVDPPAEGQGAGGMEYPTLVTGLASPVIPGRVRLPELAVVHEVAHQYWYGMSASNEFEEAWLDEGIATYCEMRTVDAWFGADRSLFEGVLGFSLGDLAMQRIGYLFAADAATVLRRSWDYPDFGVYGSMSYCKPAVLLATLERLHGTPAVDRLLRDFFAEARFRHPTTGDFLAVVRAVMGEPAEGLARRLLETTDTVNHRVLAVRNAKDGPLEGYDFSTTPPAFVEGGKKGKDVEPPLEAEVWVVRDGALVLPVEVRVEFSDGSSRTEAWDGVETPRVFRYPGKKATSVEIDPEEQVVLERYRLDNGWRDERNPRAASALAARARRALEAFFSALLAAS